jgi:ABC-type multidrug transport system ATPase subunit/ABC-type multidrug transport system permease subunit
MSPESTTAPMSEKENTGGDAVDVQDTQRRTTGGMQLRWTNLSKTVEVKEFTGGLVKGTIGGTTHQNNHASHSPNDDDDGERANDLENGGERNSRINNVSKGDRSKTKVILNSVSGYARPGEILALMGPSGSGKTTILDILSGRSSYDSSSSTSPTSEKAGGGRITLDSEIVTDRVMKKMKKRIAYVKQNDLFFGHLTVRDQLTYTALLRLPPKWDKQRKISEVNRTIRRLRLSNCADTPINKISGGEKKRVNIGSELLTDPAIILLDEPTSGLDSTSAVTLMTILFKLARDEGKTIITSIHQPSSAIFFAFDRLLLLADGYVVYFGTPNGSLDYVKKLGMECPPGYNAADHHMDLLVVDGTIDDDVDDDDVGDNDENLENGGMNEVKQVQQQMQHRRKTVGGTSTKQKLIDSWDAESIAKYNNDEDAVERAKFDSKPGVLSRRQSVVFTEKSFNTTWWTQYTVLVHRSMKNSRSAIFTGLNFIKAGAIGFMCGLLWFQMPYTESAIFDRSSYYFFTMTFWVFDAMFTAYMTFPLERAIIFKERGSGAYHLSAYFMAKTTSEAPARLTLPAIYMCISYWMSGVNNNVRIFVASTMCSLLSVLAGESIGLFLGAAVLDLERGMVIMTVVSLGLMVVGGFFVRTLPVWMIWLGYLSPFKYSYNSSVQLVFDRPVPCDGSKVISVCAGGNSGSASVEEVLKFLGVQYSVGFNVLLLFVMFVVVRIMAFFALKNKKADERIT